MILIADDFGLGRKHDRVIIELLTQGHLHGTSIMINDDIEPAQITRLIKLQDEKKIQLGLHVNLTQALAGIKTVYPIGTLLKLAIMGKLPIDKITQEIINQYEGFKQLIGCAPDFIDGHQHCHILPSIAPIIAQLPHDKNTWVRIPAPNSLSSLTRNFRAGGIKIFLIVALAKQAKRHFSHNDWRLSHDFSGFMPLNNPNKLRYWLPHLLFHASDDCVFMVHPGDRNDAMQCPNHDGICREIEAEILSCYKTA